MHTSSLAAGLVSCSSGMVRTHLSRTGQLVVHAGYRVNVEQVHDDSIRVIFAGQLVDQHLHSDVLVSPVRVEIVADKIQVIVSICKHAFC